MGRVAAELDDLARELDLVVYRLERAPERNDAEALLSERTQLRRELEGLRDRLNDAARALE
jgi:type VI protein secretion system component VasF